MAEKDAKFREFTGPLRVIVSIIIVVFIIYHLADVGNVYFMLGWIFLPLEFRAGSLGGR